MKRRQVLRKIHLAAQAAQMTYTERQLSRHSGVTVGSVSTTVPRHREIPDLLAETIFKQLEPALGKDWWRA